MRIAANAPARTSTVFSFRKAFGWLMLGAAVFGPAYELAPVPGSACAALRGQGGLPDSGETLIEFGDGWNYFLGTTAPSDPATDWRVPSFDDGEWVQGAPTAIGYGSSSGKNIATVLPASAEDDGNYITVYFRKSISVADPSSIGFLLLEIDYDDAFVAFVNGVEAARSPNAGMPGEELSFDDDATKEHEFDAKPRFFDLTASLALFQPGQNVIAVEVHNTGHSSSDLVFNCRLSALKDAAPLAPAEPACMRRLEGTTISWTNHPGVEYDSIQVTRDGVPIPGSPFAGDTTSVLDVSAPQGGHRYAITARIGGTETPPVFCSSTEKAFLCVAGDEWAYFRGTREPSPDGSGDPTAAWTALEFNDGSWERGPSGFGIGDDDDATELSDMRRVEDDPDRPGYTTLYIRKRFSVSDPDAAAGLALSVDYDDGFIAYVNGEEVARSPTMESPPGTLLAFDETSDDSHEAGMAELFQVPARLQAGENILAIQGFNRRATSGDFSLIPELIAHADLTFLCLQEGDVSCARRSDGTLVSWNRPPGAVFDSVAVLRDGVPVAGSPFPGDVGSVLDPAGAGASHTYTVVATIGGRECAPVECATSGVELNVIAAGEEWRFFKGAAEPSPGAKMGEPTLGWAGVDFDDSSWELGPSGFSYGEGLDGTILDDMQAVPDDPDTPEDESRPGYTTIYLRKGFVVADAATIRNLALSVDYDDAFVAYLNGTEVARSPNTTGNPGHVHPFEETAGSQHESGTPEVFGIDPSGLLAEGHNVLAIQGFNSSSTSSDFALIPELTANVCLPVENVSCAVDSERRQVTVRWDPSPHDAYVVLRNGVEIEGSPVPGGATSIVDTAPVLGDNVYDVKGLVSGEECPPVRCTARCSDLDPGALACTLRLVDRGGGDLVTQAALGWTIAPPGTASIEVLREGALVATLDSAQRSFTDPDVESTGPERDVEYAAVFRDGTGESLCTLSCGPLPLCPQDFACDVVADGVLLSWGNVVKEWESFTIVRNGVEIASGLPGDRTEFLDRTAEVIPALPIAYVLRPIPPDGESVSCDRDCLAVLPVPELAVYTAPSGGWDYRIDFRPGEDRYAPSAGTPGNLDGAWIRAREDSWDGSAPLVFGSAPSGDAPGGVGVESRPGAGACGEEIDVLRVLDPGNPTSPGSSLSERFPVAFDEPNNRVILLGHDTGIADRNLLRTGVTLSARWRANPSPPDFIGGRDDGDGSPIVDGLAQVGIYFFNDGSLATEGGPVGLGFNLETGDVMQMSSLPIQEIQATGITGFRSFWVTVRDPEGDGRYDVTFYYNGGLEPFGLFGTASGITLQAGDADFGAPFGNFLVISLPSIGNDGDIEIDYIAYKRGIHTPRSVACGDCRNNPPVPSVAVEPSSAVELLGASATVTFDASASHDGDGGAQGLDYFWTKSDGPAGDTIAEPNGVRTDVVFTAAGTYRYRLLVDDGGECGNAAAASVEITVTRSGGAVFRRGDTDNDGMLAITDAIRIFSFLFSGTIPSLDCEDAADADDNGTVEITDGIRILNVLFLGTGVIPSPGFTECGSDPQDDVLEGCNYRGSCAP